MRGDATFASDARRERAFTTQQIERLHDVYEPALPARTDTGRG